MADKTCAAGAVRWPLPAATLRFFVHRLPVDSFDIHQGRIPERDLLALDSAAHSDSTGGFEALRLIELESALPRFRHDRMRERMFAALVEACGDTKQLLVRVTGRRGDAVESGRPLREGAGLVNDQGVDVPAW